MTKRYPGGGVTALSELALSVERGIGLVGANGAGVSLDSAGLQVSAVDYGSFTRALPRIALRERIRVRQVLPSDESLESVFSYLVGAR